MRIRRSKWVADWKNHLALRPASVMVCTGRPNCVTNTNSVSLTEKNVRYRKTSASAPAPTHRYFKYESISILGNPLRSSRGRGNHRKHSRTSDLDTTLH